MIERLMSGFPAIVSPDILLALFLLSLLAFVGTLVAVPAILIRLPPDYFDEHHPRTWMEDHHPIVRSIGIFLKNAIGVIFLLAGLAMLVLPGQGILTMLIGVSLIDFPGKRKLERKLIGVPAVLSSINALRRKFGKPPLIVSHSGRDRKPSCQEPS